MLHEIDIKNNKMWKLTSMGALEWLPGLFSNFFYIQCSTIDKEFTHEK